MSQGDHIEFEGSCTKAMGGGWYAIELDDAAPIKARLSGKMKKNHIKVSPGDRVRVSVSPYDPSHGMITRRL